MKVIIAGSRNVLSLDAVKRAVELSGLQITEVVSGAARGVDSLGEQWAKLNQVPVKRFPAIWRDRDGTYNPRAGFQRNQEMAQYAQALIAVWDGESPGTKDMIKRAEKRGMQVFIHLV